MHEISASPITLSDLKSIISNPQVRLSESSRQAIRTCRTYLDERIARGGEAIYGINTGFGALHNKSIAGSDLVQLQINLIQSHACGMGERVPADIVRLMLYLKARGLSMGYSAAQVETVECLIRFFNEGITPVVYQQGSLGASGDLAPLSHLSLPLIAQGEVEFEGKDYPAEELLKSKGITPIQLKSKEGLALLNGTQFMSAYGAWLALKSQQLLAWADALAALSLEAYDGRPEPFTPQVHAVRAHGGQVATAAAIRKWLEGSELISQHKTHVQDPYSFRCVPQVHGASKDAIAYVTSVIEREINSVTDNPTIFPDDDLVVSAGNFHGQPLALVLDQLAIAMAEIGSISERRIYKLISGERGLPAFLVNNPGLNSGFMIPQYTAASIVSQNKSLCMPASVDTIDSSNGQEDHVSMGANAATKAYRVVENVETVLAIELMNAAQAMEFRRPAKTSPGLEALLSSYRKKVAFVHEDQYLKPLMDASKLFVRENAVAEFLK
jgi:histidine ammonia-lyase